MEKYKNYINNPYQIAGTRHYTLDNGMAKGVSAIDIKTGSGLEYTVLKDRALDISRISYKGTNLTFMARQGEVSPAYHDKLGCGWMKSFFGGLLTTCGPENIGKNCVIDGINYPQHGSFSNTPATNVADLSSLDDGIFIKGDIDFGTLAAYKICVQRSIESDTFGKEIYIYDEITNYDSRDLPLMMLYHTNYGYPLLSESARTYFTDDEIIPYDSYSEADIENVCSVSEPLSGNAEKNYFHHMKADSIINKAAIVNENLGLGIAIEFSDNLPYITHCKIECPGDYFMGIEPCNTLCLGREEIIKRDIMPVIHAGETQEFRLKFIILEGSEISEYISRNF